jgi:hypothetical protein
MEQVYAGISRILALLDIALLPEHFGPFKKQFLGQFAYRMWKGKGNPIERCGGCCANAIVAETQMCNNTKNNFYPLMLV